MGGFTTALFCFRFLFPRIAVGTNGLAFVRLSFRPVEISKSVLRKFLKLGTKLGLPNVTEMTFSDYARKISLQPFLVKST